MYPTVLPCMGGNNNSPASGKSNETSADYGQQRPGFSLPDLANEPNDTQRTVFSEYHATGAITVEYMLRNSRYKYIHYVDHGVELFDLLNDPEELKDISGDDAHVDILHGFEAQLRTLVNPEGVDAQAKADQQRVTESLGGNESVLAMPVPYATPAPAK